MAGILTKLIRNLIQLAKDENDTVAFLDQEKAFDRVNNNFLYKTMSGFDLVKVS